MFLRSGRANVEIGTERLILRPPQQRDFVPWARLRRESREFLVPWEPRWSKDHLSARSFRNRVAWAERVIRQEEALPLFLIRHEGEAPSGEELIGGITLSNIRRQPSNAATLGYWIGEAHARKGYMTEALMALVDHAFGAMELSRIEAACLPENTASRKLLERCHFHYEGEAQAYLQINGRWRNHVLYAALREDRQEGAEDLSL